MEIKHSISLLFWNIVIIVYFQDFMYFENNTPKDKHKVKN